MNLDSTFVPGVGETVHSNVQQLIIRQNQIRHIDGQPGTTTTIGIAFKCIEEASADENVINIEPVPTTTEKTVALVRSATVKKDENILQSKHRWEAGLLLERGGVG